MILCVQTLFGEACILLFDEDQKHVDSFFWQAGNKDVNVVAEIQSLLQKNNGDSKDITNFFAVQGPGPFTSVRTISVIAQTWKSQLPQMNLYAIPTGEFLNKKFDQKEYLFLSAGKTAFFSFDISEPSNFQKLPFEQLQEYSGEYGGFFHPDCILPSDLQLAEATSDPDTFQKLFEQKQQFLKEAFTPLYGAEPNVQKAN